MSYTIDGNSLVFDGTVTLTNVSAVPTTGVVTMTLTPSGGFGSIPALTAGQPGLPPILTFNTTQVAYGTTPPAATTTVTNAGGAGVASEVTVDLYINEGAPGTNGTSGALSASSDLSGTAATGDIITVSGTDPTAFQYTAFPYGNVVNASSFTAASETGTGTATLCSVSFPSSTSAWYPICFANAVVAGTTNTVVNLKAVLANNSDVVGIVRGVSGVANQSLSMNSGFGALVGTSGYGLVSAGTTATINLTAVGQASTSDAWTIASSAVSFTVVQVLVA